MTKTYTYNPDHETYNQYDNYTGRTKILSKDQYQTIYRRQLAKKMAIRLGWMMAGLVALLAVAGLIFGLIWMESNDYAGMDKKKVTERSYQYMQDWYGLKAMPKNLKLVSYERSHYGSSAAWRSVFESRRFEEGRACMYIWEVSQDEQEYAVQEGSDC